MPRAVLCLSPSSFRCSLGSCPGPAGRFSPTHLQAQPPVSTYGAPSISILLGRAPYRALSWHPELLRELAGEALVPARLPFSPARRRFSPSSLAVALCSIRWSSIHGRAVSRPQLLTMELASTSKRESLPPYHVPSSSSRCRATASLPSTRAWGPARPSHATLIGLPAHRCSLPSSPWYNVAVRSGLQFAMAFVGPRL